MYVIISENWFLVGLATLCTFLAGLNGVVVLRLVLDTDAKFTTIEILKILFPFPFFVAASILVWFLATVGVTITIIEYFQGGI